MLCLCHCVYMRGRRGVIVFSVQCWEVRIWVLVVRKVFFGYYGSFFKILNINFI